MWKVETELTPSACPYCGNEDDLEVFEQDFDGQNYIIDWDCPACGGIFAHIYQCEFVGVGTDRAVYTGQQEDDESWRGEEDNY